MLETYPSRFVGMRDLKKLCIWLFCFLTIASRWDCASAFLCDLRYIKTKCKSASAIHNQNEMFQIAVFVNIDSTTTDNVTKSIVFVHMF